MLYAILFAGIAILGVSLYTLGYNNAEDKYVFNENEYIRILEAEIAEEKAKTSFATKQMEKHDQFYIDQKEIDEDFN